MCNSPRHGGVKALHTFWTSSEGKGGLIHINFKAERRMTGVIFTLRKALFFCLISDTFDHSHDKVFTYTKSRRSGSTGAVSTGHIRCFYATLMIYLVSVPSLIIGRFERGIYAHCGNSRLVCLIRKT